jgi:hypothetical protein
LHSILQGWSAKIKMDRLAPSTALALRAIGCADVRSGILPPQSDSALRAAPE